MAHFHSILPQQGVNAIYCSWDSRIEPIAVQVSVPPLPVVAVVVVAAFKVRMDVCIQDSIEVAVSSILQ